MGRALERILDRKFSFPAIILLQAAGQLLTRVIFVSQVGDSGPTKVPLRE